MLFKKKSVLRLWKSKKNNATVVVKKFKQMPSIWVIFPSPFSQFFYSSLTSEDEEDEEISSFILNCFRFLAAPERFLYAFLFPWFNRRFVLLDQNSTHLWTWVASNSKRVIPAMRTVSAEFKLSCESRFLFSFFTSFMWLKKRSSVALENGTQRQSSMISITPFQSVLTVEEISPSLHHKSSGFVLTRLK